MPAFKISEIVEPRWEVEFPDGSKKEFDPWKLQQEIFESQQTAVNAQERYDGIRKAFGLPIESEAGDAFTFTFTRNQCLAASGALGEYIDQLPVSKKALSLSQKSNASSGSPSQS